jgi:hypothetical protein
VQDDTTVPLFVISSDRLCENQWGDVEKAFKEAAAVIRSWFD